MKRLYLIRHAKSSWNNHLINDFDRPLNHRGKENAPFMGEKLCERKVKPDLLISSPAKRAIKTAKRIAEKIHYHKSDIIQELAIYEAHPEEIIQIIENVEKKVNDLMLVGHNPGFTMLANHLGNETIGNMPTCGVVCIEFEMACWSLLRQTKGKTLFFDYPKNY